MGARKKLAGFFDAPSPSLCRTRRERGGVVPACLFNSYLKERNQRLFSLFFSFFSDPSTCNCPPRSGPVSPAFLDPGPSWLSWFTSSRDGARPAHAKRHDPPTPPPSQPAVIRGRKGPNFPRFPWFCLLPRIGISEVFCFSFRCRRAAAYPPARFPFPVPALLTSLRIQLECARTFCLLLALVRNHCTRLLLRPTFPFLYRRQVWTCSCSHPSVFDYATLDQCSRCKRPRPCRMEKDRRSLLPISVHFASLRLGDPKAPPPASSTPPHFVFYNGTLT